MIEVKNKDLKGQVKAIPSKSYAHRALIAAALADGDSRILFDESSDDIDFTISVLEALGSEISAEENGVLVKPLKKTENTPYLDVGESGTTFRLILPVASSIYEECIFKGRGRLSERPIAELMEAMKSSGVTFDSEKLPFTTSGKLRPGIFKMPGDVSSQYISGLLFAAPLLEGKSEILLTSRLESKPYVDITIDVLKGFGIKIGESENRYTIYPQAYRARNYTVEGDWSNGAFFLVAGALGQGISVSGLNMDSTQGDMRVVGILKDFGADIEMKGDVISVRRNKLQPVAVDLTEIPDALPILAIAAAAVENGVSRFYNGKRLRLKESDRLNSVATMIRNLGGKVEENEEELLVYGTGGLRGGTTSSFGDHRLVMAAAIGSMISDTSVVINNPRAVTKSYPKFFYDFIKLGGEVLGQHIW
ncbi:MAG: 3-phosphoshikimate 1-carboxyvinyltransferase [Tissierellia bacterium]|nr:3-phosphoshikimate 1-carboxyvinyltransferase [Tissierellia bacterium]